MKKTVLILGLLFLIIACKKNYTSYNNVQAEASCGQCMFDMDGSGCDLAVKIEEEYYFIEGTAIDDHGDAHADDGFCKAIKKVTISGKAANGKINVSSFKINEE